MMLEASVAEPAWLRTTSAVQYWYGPVIFAMWLVVTLMLSVMTAGKSGSKDSDTSHSNKGGSHSPFHLETGPTGRRVFVSICWLLSFSFLIELWWLMAQARSLHVDFLASEVPYWTNTARLSYIYSSVSLYLFFGVTLYSSKHGPGLTHLISWVLGLAFEIFIIVATLIGLPLCDDPTNLLDNVCFDNWAQGRIVIASVRSFVMLGVILILSATLFQSYQYHAKWQADAMDSHSDTASTSDCDSPECDETTGLLKTQETDYGTSASVTPSETSKAPCSRGRDEEAGFYRPKKLPKRNWWEYLSSYGLFWKYVWPANRRDLQFRVFLCFCILVLQRIVNVMVPWQMGRLMDYITGPENRDGLDPEFTTQFLIYVPWVEVALLDFLFMFQGTAGVLGALRSLLWIDVSQFSYRAVEVAAFQHVHSLSLDFHLGKKTGEVLSALNKGASINNFLEQVTFNLFPMLFDLFIGVYFFSSAFDGFYGTIVCVNTIWYVWISINLARARADERREMTNADREEEAVKNDSITSYETVKYFNAEEFEYNRYAEAIDRFQAAEARLNYQTSRMTLIQACVFSGGLSLVVVIGCWQLAHGTISGGRFVTLLSYLLQMQGPLNFFNQFYRTMQQALISGERLLELFNYKPSVIDHAKVESLNACTGHITWEDVAFAYADKTMALKNLSFECLPGTTTAFVGESGGGKSTVFRLMFRYYDSSEGAIKIDGKKVSDLSIQSVRQHIGVVPQETILFNETLMFNLRYANPKASDEDIYWACKAAKIHDKIMSFPDKYQTKVGERGMRLSGGEKQRVAIARTMLKDPKIILLDEATSALDTQTEQEIQGELAQLGVGRTLMIIAHRLSTITHADQIIVMNKGEIVEKGTHEMLLKKRGYYYSMWNQQIKTERAVQKTQKLLQQKALLKRSGVPAPSSDESESSSSGSSSPDQNSLEGEALVDVTKLNTDESDLVDGTSLSEPAIQAETRRE